MRVTVTTMLPTKLGFHWFFMDVDEPTIEAIYVSLVEHAILRGTRIDTVTGPDRDTRIITGRKPLLLGIGMIGTVTPIERVTIIDPNDIPEPNPEGIAP